MQHTIFQRLIWFLYWLFLVVSFCVIGTLLVTEAIGYRYNSHSHRLQKLGMLVIGADPRDSRLQFDGHNYDLAETKRIPNILPGDYRVEVSKRGYSSWEDTITIQSGFVVTLPDIKLFYKNPQVVPVTKEYQAMLTDPFIDDRLRLIDGEMWFNDTLVSRFVNQPYAAVVLPTDRHIAYVQNNQIRLIEINGHHDQLLYTRDTDQSTLLVLGDNRTLVFNDATGPKAIRIR